MGAVTISDDRRTPRLSDLPEAVEPVAVSSGLKTGRLGGSRVGMLSHPFMSE